MNLQEQICGSLRKAYASQPIKSYTNTCGTEVKVFNLNSNQMAKETKKTQTDCPACDGSGKNDFTPCCGAGYDSDILMCHDCKEHLGEDDLICEDCNGTGLVDSTEEIPVDDYHKFIEARDAARADLPSSELTEDDYIQEGLW